MAKLFRGRGVQAPDNTSLRACFTRLVNYKNNEPVSHDTLAINIGSFFTAGYETTAHLINWALFELAAHPDLQVSPGLQPTLSQTPCNLPTEILLLHGWQAIPHLACPFDSTGESTNAID